MTKQENSYSLWLRPSQTQIDDLTKIISRLSHRFSCTPFPPHITLLPGNPAITDSIIETCEAIIKRYPAFDITLEEIAYTPAYFRSLYILAKPETPLINIYEDTKKRLNHESSKMYMPHISLLYGNLDAKKQQTLKEELADSYAKTFHCQRLDLYNTTGHEMQWHLIKSFQLRDN